MSPIDDELRAALHGRATVLTPSPDPLAGIERRARRMRRNRAATAVAGSVVAVAAIALAVPALTPTPAPVPLPPATSLAPSPVPSAAPAPVDEGFTFAAPWPYRGDSSLLADGTLATVTREWAALEGVPVEQVELVALFGSRDEPSGRDELLYAARTRDSSDGEVGLVRLVEGPQFLSRRPFADRDALLLVPAGGDEVGRLFAIASPDAERLEYAPDGRTFREMAVKAAGVGLTALDGDPADHRVRLTSRGGATLTADAPPSEQAPSAAEPDNLLDWPFRGPQDDALVERAARGYAQAKGVARAQVEWVVLANGGTDGGLAYSVLQAWVTGQRAQVFAWVERPGVAPEPVLQPLTDPGEPVVAVLLTDVPGRTTDELVVLPQPRTGQVLYTDANGQQRPVEPAPGLDGIVLVDRERGAEGDRLTVLDGNGDLDAPTFDGLVSALLCGESGCG